jgi:hypothetical protein
MSFTDPKKFEFVELFSKMELRLIMFCAFDNFSIGNFLADGWVGDRRNILYPLRGHRNLPI